MDQRQLKSLIATGAIADLVIFRDPPASWGLLALGPDLPADLGKRLRVELHTARGEPRRFKTLDAAAASLADLEWSRTVTLDGCPWGEAGDA
jgi:hypothetical protein